MRIASFPVRPVLAWALPMIFVLGCANGGSPPSTTRLDAGRTDSGSSGCDPACISPEVCISGLCQIAAMDADGDGVSTALDCDDTDPTVRDNAERPCSGACGAGVEICTAGEWAACTAPTDCDCTAGTPARTIPCARCGMQRQTCTGGTWVDDGACEGAGACDPGSTEMGAACGCGTQRRSCTSACEWTDFVCVGDCFCGDGTCNGAETCGTCPSDCGACAATCGDGSCNGSETCTSCPSDCGACPPRCGDGSCNGIETCTSCSGDCGACPSSCGDGTCDATESCASCVDCQAGHMMVSANNGDPCPGIPAETWRCVNITSFGTWGSQVCRSGAWVTFHLNPRDCGACVCSYSSACAA